MNGCRLRSMAAADAPAVAELSADAGAARWDAAAFVRELALPQARLKVVEDADRVVAFAVWWHVVDEIHLLNIVVHPNHRRGGLAVQLMDALVTDAQAVRARALCLEVRAGNAPALALYLRYGFEVVGRRRRYYADGEDAILMERVLHA
jgi:ribosomal-protein-alanine N-acetyltransferase